MRRRLAPLRFLTALTVAAIGAATFESVAAPVPAARQDPGSPAAPQYFGTASGWSYRGSTADASASTLLSSAGSTGLVLLFCEGNRIGFHISLGATDRRSLTGSEDGLLQVYASDPPRILHEDEPGQGTQDEDEDERRRANPDVSDPGDTDAGPGKAGDASGELDRLPDVPLLAQFPIRFFSDFDFRSLPLRQPEWDTPDRLLEIMKDQPGGLRLAVMRLRQARFTSTRMADIYLPVDTDGSGLAMETVFAFLERDCRTGLKSEDTDAGSEPAR